MSPAEFWLEFDDQIERARRREQAEVGGKSVPATALREAQAKARKLHKRKREEIAA
jgi:hypothetical protein